MFALLAAVCFLLVMFGVGALGPVNLTVLGFFFIALELLLGWRPWHDLVVRRPPQ
jgi:hypothetical protein